MVHHGDEKVEQDDDVDDGERAEHDQAPEPRELLDPGELKVVQVDQTEGGPEQGLACFPKTENLASLTKTESTIISALTLQISGRQGSG